MHNLENFDIDELTALARLDIEQGRTEQALAKLKRVLAGSPAAAPDAVGMAARLYAQLGLFQRAQPLFEQYLSVRPESIEEEFQLGMVQLDKGDSEQALKTWEGMLERQPIFPPALFYCAVVLSRQGRIADARRNLDVLLQTASADNLYFGKGKELLHSLGSQATQLVERSAVYQG